MDKQVISSIISLVVAIVVLSASYLQWWDQTYDGKMLTKCWVKTLLTVSILALVIALLFIVL